MAFPLNVPRRNESGPRELTPVTKEFEQFGARARNYVDAAGLWCTLGYSALAFQARQPGEPDLAGFFGLIAWTGRLRAPSTGSPKPSRTLPVAQCFLGSIFKSPASWEAVIRGTTSSLSLDGFALRQPLRLRAASEEFFVDLSASAFQNVLDRHQNPRPPTIYAPLTEVLFLVWLRL